LIDAERQWFKSKVGLEVIETHRDLAFCAHSILQPDISIVSDALADPRFTTNPLVTSEPYFRFYAGVPLRTPEGYALGTLCVIDHVPRKLKHKQIRALQALSRQVTAQLELRRNVADLTRTNEALCKSEERFKTFMNNSPVMAFMKDEEGRLVYINEPFERVFNVKQAELLGKTDFEWLPAVTAKQVHENDLAVFSMGKTLEVLEAVPTPDGCLHYWLVFKFLVKDVLERRLLGGVAVDITERKQAEEELCKALEREKELNELKSRFVSMTSHEFRTPLTTILGSTELLKHYSYTWSDEKKLFYLNRIQATVHHLNRMIDDVLLLGKVEAGKLEFRPKKLNLVQFCCSLVEDLQQQPNVERKLIFHSCGKCFVAYMDEKLLKQILDNLLSNAIKYTAPGSSIVFKLFWDDEMVVFQIIDKGIGIPREDIEHLFESFYRARNVSNIPGTGLGLAIVRKAVDLHRGKISVNSEVGVGTIFTVTIPLINKEQADDENSGH